MSDPQAMMGGIGGPDPHGGVPQVIPAPPGTATESKPRSLGRDALDDLRKNPVVIVSAVLILHPRR